MFGLLGLGLLVLWTIGMLVDATVWLSWTVGLLALVPLVSIGVLCRDGAGPLAGLCLLLTAAALLGTWLAALAMIATPWRRGGPWCLRR